MEASGHSVHPGALFPPNSLHVAVGAPALFCLHLDFVSFHLFFCYGGWMWCYFILTFCLCTVCGPGIVFYVFLYLVIHVATGVFIAFHLPWWLLSLPPFATVPLCWMQAAVLCCWTCFFCFFPWYSGSVSGCQWTYLSSLPIYEVLVTIVLISLSSFLVLCYRCTRKTVALALCALQHLLECCCMNVTHIHYLVFLVPSRLFYLLCTGFMTCMTDCVFNPESGEVWVPVLGALLTGDWAADWLRS